MPISRTQQGKQTIVVQTKLSNREYSDQLTLMTTDELKREHESVHSLELITHDDIFFFWHKRRKRVESEMALRFPITIGSVEEKQLSTQLS